MSPEFQRTWRRTLRSCGSQIAVVQAMDGRTITFQGLDDRASNWLAGQQAKSLRGRAVILSFANGIDWLTIFLGLLKAGAVIVPLDGGEPEAAQEELAGVVRASFICRGKDLIPQSGARLFRDKEICLIKLTSGSTGRPRPLVFKACQLLADAKQATVTMGLSEGDLAYAVIPLGHSYALGTMTVPLFAFGLPLVCGSSPLPMGIAKDFVRWHPTFFPGVPPIWRALAASQVSPSALRSLRLAISAGGALPPDVARAFGDRFQRRVHGHYGSSETGGIAFDRSGDAALVGGVGQPMQGVKVKVTKKGTFRVRSAAVFTIGNRERDGVFGTCVLPDRVAVDPRGAITILGRRGTTVKILGRRVNLIEVVDGLKKLRGVRDAWVGISAEPDPVLGAAVLTKRMPTALRRDLQGAIAPWKIPKRLIAVSSFPFTSRGKLETRAIHAMVFGPQPPEP